LTCSKCLGARRWSFKEEKQLNNLACHFVESSAEQIPFCNCHRPFKFSYVSRALSVEQLTEGDDKGWVCLLCQKTKANGELHLACFACPAVFAAINEKKNLEVCMSCAIRTKLIICETVDKIDEVGTLVHCPQDNNMLVFTSRQKDNKLSFDCYYCKKSFFGYTERFYCNYCSLNCCDDCKGRLWEKNPPICPQVPLF
jgi:hypothetical protein